MSPTSLVVVYLMLACEGLLFQGSSPLQELCRASVGFGDERKQIQPKTIIA